MTLEWPAAFLLMFIILIVGVTISTPTRRRHELEMAQVKGKSNEEYRVLAGKFAALAQETRELETAMQADLAAARASVASIEAMMREVS